MQFKDLSIRRILLLVCCIAILMRIGYGVARFGSELTVSGAPFIALWDFDAIEHVLIAKSIISGQGYTVSANADSIGKHVRYIGSYALYKAPLYQYFLAVLFDLGGFSFALFFPIQALFGGALSGLVVLITNDVFNSRRAGLYAGLAAATHPVLINTASQPYNENVFFFFFALTIWLFLQWLRNRTLELAVVFGVAAGTTALIRESILGPFLLMIAFGALTFWSERRMLGVANGLTMMIAAVLTIAPWTLYNYRNLGVVVPVSSITGTVFGTGNNECLAVEDMTTPFYGDSPACESLVVRRMALIERMPVGPSVVINDRVGVILGARFVKEHPIDYFRLCVRRLWTALLPFHPKQELGTGQKSVMLAYYILVLIVGAVSAVRCTIARPSREIVLLLIVLFSSFMPLILIFVSHDLRFRVGIDLILGCFAGYGWTRMLKQRSKLRPASLLPSSKGGRDSSG